jgi:hypothetical protein
MINQAYVDKLVSLIKHGLISVQIILKQEYKDAVVDSFKQEVIKGIITPEQYTQYTGLEYAA